MNYYPAHNIMIFVYEIIFLHNCRCNNGMCLHLFLIRSLKVSDTELKCQTLKEKTVKKNASTTG